MGDPSRWEQGSGFHWVCDMPAECTPEGSMPEPWRAGGALYGSGRDALRALLTHGRQCLGWERLWVPSYYCQDVLASLRSTGIDMAVYPSGPQDSHIQIDARVASPGSVALVFNHFGLRASAFTEFAPAGIPVIEDHTHDPWSEWARTSKADWCIASLRKTLPIPDGGVLWSPAGHPLPPVPQVSLQRQNASLRKLAAMALKSLYLSGGPVAKEDYRRLAQAGEADIASGPISGMPGWTASLLHRFPVKLWRERRRANHHTLCRALADLTWVTVLQPEAGADACSFSGVLLFDSTGRREHVRKLLIGAQVCPEILWSLEHPALGGVAQRDVDFSRRMLSIHCDMRYAEPDMMHVAELVGEFADDTHS